MPVNTMAMPCSSAAAMTSSSRIEPPGWITALIPAWAALSMPSRNGKKASEAITEPGTSSPACSALMAAMRAELTRLIWPAPTPMVMLPLAYTIALDLTYLATRQANSRSRISASVGARLVTTLISLVRARSASCTNKPPLTRLKSRRWPGSAGHWPHSSTRTFFLAAAISTAAALTLGAMMTSTN